MGRCEPCDATAKWPWAIVALLIILLLLLWYFMAWRPLTRQLENMLILRCYAALGIERVQTDAETRFQRYKRHFLENFDRDAMKVMISFFQVGGSFITTFAVDWPPKLVAVMSVASAIFQLDFLGFPGLTCLTENIFFTYKLMISTLFPVIGVMLLLLPTVTARMLNVKDKVLHEVQHFFWQALFLFLFATYPAASFTCLKAFSCRDLGTDGYWLRADLGFPCPLPHTDPLTFFWAVAATAIIPFGIPAYIMHKLRSHHVPRLARTKKERGVLSAFLMKWHKHKVKLEAYTEVFGTNSKRKEVKWRIKEAFSRLNIPHDTWVGMEQLREILYVMGLELDDDEMLRIINVHGTSGFINKLGIRTALREIAIRAKHKPDIVTGKEDPSELSNLQLKALCVEPWERRADYRAQDDESVRDVISGEAFVGSERLWSGEVAADEPQPYEGYTNEELKTVLMVKAKFMQQTGDLNVMDARWDGSTEQERMAIDHLGFLFLTYLPKYWWFELYEMLRKLVIAACIVFIYDGTPSQVAVGFIITFATVVVSLFLQPFNDPVLGGLYTYALMVQMITLFYGVLLITDSFEEIVNERTEGWAGGFNVRDFVLALNCSIFTIPILKLLIQKADFGGWIEHFKQRIMHKLGIKRKLHKTAAQRRAEMREALRDLVIRVNTADPIRPMMMEEDGGLRVGEAGQVLSDLPVVTPDKYDEGAGVRRPDDDPYTRDPTEVEFTTIRRMARHVELLEANAYRLIADKNNGITDELRQDVEDFRILLDEMRVDAQILADNVPEGEDKDLVEDIAEATIDRLYELLGLIVDEADFEPVLPGALPPVPNLRVSIEEAEAAGSGGSTPTLDSPRQAADIIPEKQDRKTPYLSRQPSSGFMAGGPQSESGPGSADDTDSFIPAERLDSDSNAAAEDYDALSPEAVGMDMNETSSDADVDSPGSQEHDEVEETSHNPFIR